MSGGRVAEVWRKNDGRDAEEWRKTELREVGQTDGNLNP